MAYVLSIEPVEGPSFRLGSDLGTDLGTARQAAEAQFHERNAAGEWTRTVALFRGKSIVDVFDGQWQSEWLSSFDDLEA